MHLGRVDFQPDWFSIFAYFTGQNWVLHEMERLFSQVGLLAYFKCEVYFVSWQHFYGHFFLTLFRYNTWEPEENVLDPRLLKAFETKRFLRWRLFPPSDTDPLAFMRYNAAEKIYGMLWNECESYVISWRNINRCRCITTRRNFNEISPRMRAK